MLVLSYLNVSKIIKSSFSALSSFEWAKSFPHDLELGLSCQDIFRKEIVDKLMIN
jgi:hypothetical protein